MWRRWGTPQNFCLTFIDELEKQLFIKKLLKWANKICKNIYNLTFFKKIKKNTCNFTPMYQKYWWYDLQFLRYRVWQTEIGHYGSFFALLHPSLKMQKIRILKKKIAGDIIILHMCTKSHNHMRYGSWYTKWDRQKILSFWIIFYTFTPLTTRKIKILKKWKENLEMSSFYTCVPKITIIWCMLPEMWSVTDIIYL